MVVQALINRGIAPLRPSDTVEHALGMLMEYRVRHLPTVTLAGELVGLVSEEQLLDAEESGTTVGSLLQQVPVHAKPDLHVFEATRTIVEHGLTVLPVATENMSYLGVVKRHDIFDLFARMLSTQESGAILALEVDPADYSLSRLVYSIEQSDVKILSIASETPETEGKVRVTLKLNVNDTSRVRHVLEHEGYQIVAAFSEYDDDEDLKMRVQEFMRYLEV
ncbi:MAG: CBS domain-containing protein [Rhodothermales bacterium]|nr:CBS domain-containing protein [Rhodothermales bacterium]